EGMPEPLLLFERAEQAINAPCAGTGRHHPQIEVTVQHRLFAAVRDRPEAARRPGLEIRDRHFTAEDEGREPRKQAERQEHRTNRFQKPRKTALDEQTWN